MNRLQQALREAAGIILSSAVLGFGYTALTDQGVFAESAPDGESAPVSASSVIQLPEAQELFESGDALFVDARHEFDFEIGHIAGAINIPLAEAELRLNTLGKIPRDKTVVVYCDGAECNSSFALAVRMRGRGFSDVRVFFGGWNEWQNSNLPSDGKTP